MEDLMNRLPCELIQEILLRLPTNKIEMCVLLSPACATVVRRPSFYRELYLRSSSIRKSCALFLTKLDSRCIFRSVSVLEQEPRPLLLSSTDLYSTKFEFFNYSCGLICSGFGANPRLFNPSNGRRRILPDVFNCEKEVRSFLGFGYETGFKVLAITKNVCKVLTLDTPNWRTLNFIPHLKPASSSICIDGIIYYATYLKPTIMALVSFSLQTESFHINQIPQTPRFGMFFFEKVMDVKGNVGVSFAAGCDTHMLRVLENGDKDMWSERLLKAPDSIILDIEQSSPLCFEGFTKYGDAVFSQEVESKKVVYYWDGGNVVRKNSYEGLSSTRIFLDHVNTTIFF